MQRTASQDSPSRATDRPRRAKWFVRAAQEPLLHFILLGTALFIAAHMWGDSSNAPQDTSIVVTQGNVLRLIQTWQRTWQRPPTREELDGLIQDYIDEEVFYREALAMGLDQDDTVIRRRLRQKLEFVAEDLADAVEPTDEQLQRYLEDHPDQFRLEQRVTFAQVYFSSQRRGDKLQSDVRQALDQLRAGDEGVDMAELGDPLLLPARHDRLRKSEIDSLFGPQFTAQLLAAEPHQWTGPITSGYGVHLVRIDDRVAERLPGLDEVRDAVRREWFAERRAQSKEQFYDSLRDRYEVTIEMPSAGQETNDIDGGSEAETESP